LNCLTVDQLLVPMAYHRLHCSKHQLTNELKIILDINLTSLVSKLMINN